MIRQVFFLLLLCIPAFIVLHCSPGNELSHPDPRETLLNYRQLRNEWKVKDAYILLADTCKSLISETEFIKYNDLPDRIKKNQEYRIMSIDTLPVFGLRDYARFKVAFQFVDLQKKDTIDGIWYYSLYFENGQWKIIWLSKMLDYAVAYLQNQQYEESERLFQVILNINPFNDSALRGLALSYANLSETEKAIAAAEKMLSLNPDDPSAYALLADLNGSANRFEESIELYTKAIEMNPSALYFVNLGSFYKMNEQYVEADESYRKSLELDSLQPQGWWMLGELYHQNLEDMSLARMYFEKAIELPPMSDNFQQQLYYGYAGLLFDEALTAENGQGVYDKRKLLQEAETFIGKALAINPRNTDFTYLLNEINNEKEKL